ncbi:MAG: hypothetical protein PHS23_08195, partial [Candidatus Cloacimonetes bacterium]|nr:hypothetical protein [Candidatus Cloacimonadota bacterium]
GTSLFHIHIQCFAAICHKATGFIILLSTENSFCNILVLVLTPLVKKLHHESKTIALRLFVKQFDRIFQAFS